jgi:hypothetical protein
MQSSMVNMAATGVDGREIVVTLKSTPIVDIKDSLYTPSTNLKEDASKG